MKIRDVPPSGRARIATILPPPHPIEKVRLTSANCIAQAPPPPDIRDAAKYLAKLGAVHHAEYPYRYDRMLLAELVIEFYHLMPHGFPVNADTYATYVPEEREILLRIRTLADKIMSIDDKWGCPAYAPIADLLHIEEHFFALFEIRQKQLSVLEDYKPATPPQIFIKQLVPKIDDKFKTSEHNPH